MRRLFILTVSLSLAVLAFGQHPASPQSLPSKKEAVGLLEKAKESTWLTVPGRAPFHLAAKVRYTVGANSSDGTYEVLWAGPGRFREEFRLGPISELDVALDDKLYILRNSPVLTYPQWRVRMLTGLPDRKTSPFKFQVSKIYSSGGAGENLVCFDFAESSKGRTECIDSVTGQLVSVEHKAKHGETTIGLVEDRFISLDPVNYPGHMLSTIGNESLEVTVEKLEPVAQFAGEAFIPPAGASSRDWCANPEVGKQPDPLFFSRLAIGISASLASKKFHGYYLQVAPDGHVERVAEIYPDGTAKSVGDGDLSQGRLSIHSCAGKQIEYETAFVFFPIP